jgi:hypothetical protein
MKHDKLTRNIFQSLLMAAVVAVATPLSHLSFAQDLAASVNNLNTGFEQAPLLVSTASYILGGALCIAGFMKLKAHSENPTQTPLGQGLGRVGAGAAMLALPAAGQWLITTLSVGNAAAAYIPFTAAGP